MIIRLSSSFHCSLTAAWAPYFDDMDAIIFLAPIRWVVQVANSYDSTPLSPYLSCFDQVLEEDHRVNRLVSVCCLFFQTVPDATLLGRLLQAMDNDSLKSTPQAYKSHFIFEQD